MRKTVLEPGDVVYAARPIYNDGTLPEAPEAALIAEADCRGVIVNTGHLEEQPESLVFLVRFEGENSILGPPVGCWEEDIRPEAVPD